MASPGQQLLDAFRSQLVELLGQGLDSLRRDGRLTGVESAQEFAGTGLEGHVLDPLALGAGRPILAVLDRTLAVVPEGEAIIAGLHEWTDPTGTGFAYAVRSGDFAFALAVTGSGPEARLTVAASGSSAGASAALGNGWSLTASGQVSGSLFASLGLQGPPRITAATPGDAVEIGLAREGPGTPLGVPGGPSVVLGSVAIKGRVSVAGDTSLTGGGTIRLRGGRAQLAPGALAAVLPDLRPIPLDLDLDVDPGRGVSLGGSSELRTHLGGSDGGVDLVLDVGVGPAGVTVAAGVRTPLEVALPGVPVKIRFADLGLQVPYSFGPGGVLGFQAPAALDPTGVGVKLDLPVISGSGLLRHPPNSDGYAGGLSVKLPPLSATAFGVLNPPHGDEPLSLVALLSATFPPPGIQIGFGFAVTGLGGVVGINRRVDRNALLRAVTDGSAAALLFPTDPSRAADAVVGALGSIFPPARGSFVVGPMLQISWGGRMVSAQVAVLTEASRQVRLTILGKIVVAMPDPEAPLILLQATFAGVIDPGEPSAVFVASLAGSHIVGLPLTGDLCLVTRGGGDPTFVLSAGGFHPAFSPPRGVPPMSRLGMDLSPNPLIDLRVEGYFALTTNTVQFGAKVELVAEVADCGLRGHLQFDALVQWSPYLAFIAEMSAGIAVEFAGEELAGIHLDLRLSGPTPWHVRGSGKIDLFLFDVSFPFEVEWGSPPPLPKAAPDVHAELVRALSAREAWTVHRSRQRVPVTLSLPADDALSSGTLVDPNATLTARQRRVPLGLDIERLDRTPVARQRWDIVSGQLGRDRPTALGQEVTEQFAPGEYLPLSDDEALGERSFKPFRAGAELQTGAKPRPVPRATSIDFIEDVVADDPPPVLVLPPFVLIHEVELLLATTLRHPRWWEPPPEKHRIAVLASAPVTVASGWALRARSGAPIAASLAELRQQPAVRADATLVEQWELAGT